MLHCCLGSMSNTLMLQVIIIDHQLLESLYMLSSTIARPSRPSVKGSALKDKYKISLLINSASVKKSYKNSFK
jgi:hypothetical protein